jgi:hypothetical protein
MLTGIDFLDDTDDDGPFECGGCGAEWPDEAPTHCPVCGASWWMTTAHIQRSRMFERDG